MLRARASSSGSRRSWAACSASAVRARASAAWRTMNSTATAAAASSTTRKLAMAYFSLKLAAVTCSAARYPPRRTILTAARDLALRSGLVAGPNSLYMSEHEPAHGRHGIGGRGEDGWPPPQQLPALAAQYLPQVVDVAVDRLEVGVVPAVQDFQVAVGSMEIPIETLLAHITHELRRLPQQIQSRGIFHLRTLLAHRQRHSTEHELGVQPVAALLEITAIGHLRDHVGSAEQVTQHDVAGIGNAGLDVLERHLVAGEVDDLARDGHPGAEAEHRQVLLEEARAARDVRAGELGAVLRLVIIRAAQVADIVKQPGDEPDRGTRAPETMLLLLLPLVTDDQPGERECYVERVLAIVVDSVDTVIAGHLAGKQPLEVGKGATQGIERHARPGGAVERLHGREHRLRRAHLHAVGYVEVAAPGVGHLLCWRHGFELSRPFP